MDAIKTINQLKSCKGNDFSCIFKEGWYCFVNNASDILLLHVLLL